MKYAAELEDYLNSLTSRAGKNIGKPIGDGEKRHIRSAVTIFIMAYLKDKDWPCDEDYNRYAADRRTDKRKASEKASEDVTKANISRIKKFFSWLEECGAQATQSGQNAIQTQWRNTLETTPSDENATKPTEADKTVDAVLQDDESNEKRTEATHAIMEKATTTTQEAPAEAVTAPALVKHGRKPKSATGEIKSGKITAYFTFTQLEGLRALCAIDEMSMAELFNEIVDEKLEREKEAIEEYLAFRDKVQAKRGKKN